MRTLFYHTIVRVIILLSLKCTPPSILRAQLIYFFQIILPLAFFQMLQSDNNALRICLSVDIQTGDIPFLDDCVDLLLLAFQSNYRFSGIVDSVGECVRIPGNHNLTVILMDCSALLRVILHSICPDTQTVFPVLIIWRRANQPVPVVLRT